MRYLLSVIYIYVLFLSCSKNMVNRNDVHAKILSFDSIEVVTIHEGYMSSPCEPTISIDPTNDNNVVAGAVLDNIYTSEDGGRTWKKDKMKSTSGVYGDPVIRHTGDGGVLYAHLSNPAGKAYNSDDFLDRIVVQRSIDKGQTWTDGSSPMNNRKKDQDKHWLTISPIDGKVLMSWTEFDRYGSKEPETKSRILFSTSGDGGLSWSDSKAISDKEGDCLDDDLTTEGAFSAVGTDGNYYVIWAVDSILYMDISQDGGKTWLDHDRVIAKQPGGWSFDIPGIKRANGFPVIKCDHSKGKHRGRLYVTWSDQRNGIHDTDIWLMSSIDQGRTWSTPKRVNNDEPGKHQFFSWMDIDQTTGFLYFVFYDRRHHSDNQTDVYMAYSTDGGMTFENLKISQASFLPEPYVFFGDYNDISAHNGKIRPIWTRQDKTKLSVQTAVINVK
jgi:hypothetical protein